MTGGGHDHTMLGIGVFYILFWVGLVLGHSLGLHILTMLGVGVVAGYGGLVVIADLERSGRIR
jgi:hypothetical protein